MTPEANPGPAGTPSLADFTGEALILPQLAARDMAGAILELSRAFAQAGANWDTPKLNQLALEREQQMSTAMPFGAAFPHVRSAVCPELRFALGRSAKPFPWGPRGSPEVRFVFLNAVPADDALGYLKLLSGMARLGKDAALWAKFQAAATAQELLALLANVPVRR